jgi:cyclopropane fatty-acyl-phospholipid synthase-like methyltransferase
MTIQDEVRRYYDVNTKRFKSLGQGGEAIHRAVRGEGVQTREEAFRYVDRLVLGELRKLRPAEAELLHVLDLGCGVGATLRFLASQAAIRGTGATISGIQAAMAREYSAPSSLVFLEADFIALPSTLPVADLVFSIEAFVHASSPEAYFAAAARYLAPGGRLFVCDDFLTTVRESNALSPKQQRLLHEVKTDWLANTLVTAQRANAIAASHGFRLIENRDLTPSLELRRPRDVLLTALIALGRRLPLTGYRWRSLRGGNALQLALVSGLVEYRALSWTRD